MKLRQRQGSNRTQEQAFEEQMLRGRFHQLLTDKISETDASQAELAATIGVSPGRVSQMLSSPDALSLKSIAMLCDALGIWVSLKVEPADEAYRAEPEAATVELTRDKPRVPQRAQPSLRRQLQP